MSKIAIFLADGCEEIEALTVVDVMRRADIEIVMVSVTGQLSINGSHKIRFEAEQLFDETDFDSLDGVVLPGGLVGTNHLKEHAGVNRIIKKFADDKKLVAAICAAPSVLGAAGILEGKEATCHPGFENALTGAEIVTGVPAVRDKNIITSRGMGTAIDFALEIVRFFRDDKAVYQVRKHLVF